MVFCLASVAQSQNLSGRITAAENGEPLPGVSILVKGTNQGTTTDNNGKYSLKLPDNSATLVVSFIGYLKQELAVGGRSTLDISLSVDTKALEEVVVVGYGVQQKVNLTGAVGVADSKRLENRPIANAGEGLQGVIPNLNIAQEMVTLLNPFNSIFVVMSLSTVERPWYWWTTYRWI